MQGEPQIGPDEEARTACGSGSAGAVLRGSKTPVQAQPGGGAAAGTATIPERSAVVVVSRRGGEARAPGPD